MSGSLFSLSPITIEPLNQIKFEPGLQNNWLHNFIRFSQIVDVLFPL